MWLFLSVPWVGLQCVIVVIPVHTHFLVMLLMIHKLVAFLGRPHLPFGFREMGFIIYD